MPDHMSLEDRSRFFDDWAAHYDKVVKSTQDFPLDGYEQVLDRIVKLANVQSHSLILDLGTGTGNLAERFVALGCTVWGMDFSSKMLAKAQIKLPQVSFIQADLLSDWPVELDQRFDRIVSAYVLHEFNLSTKVRLLERLARQYLSKSGYIVIGDIAFSNSQTREQAHKRWAKLWDEDEDYWVADKASVACKSAELQVQYSQISSCGGVFVIKPILPN